MCSVEALYRQVHKVVTISYLEDVISPSGSPLSDFHRSFDATNLGESARVDPLPSPRPLESVRFSATSRIVIQKKKEPQVSQEFSCQYC